MTKVKKIPKFKTIAEEARFWDTHDVTDYFAEMTEAKVSFDPLVPKEETLTIRVQTTLKKRLEKIAKSYGVNLSTLLRIWFIDKAKEAEKPSLLS